VGVVVAEGHPPVVRVDGCLAAVTARHLVSGYAPGLRVRCPSFGTGESLGGGESSALAVESIGSDVQKRLPTSDGFRRGGVVPSASLETPPERETRR
jgi:hypothetical protein